MAILTTQSLKNFWQMMQGRVIPTETGSAQGNEQNRAADQRNELPINHNRQLMSVAVILLTAVGIAYAVWAFVAPK